MQVAVVQGGRSLEREISLRSGGHVASALRHLGYDTVEVDVDERLTSKLSGVSAAFVALHGRDGEDGAVQLVLEALGVAYTGSDPLACQLSYDKSVAKGLFRRAGIPTPEGFVLSEEAVRHMGAGAALREGATRLGYPIVVKPVNQGSALGLAVVHDAKELAPAVMTAFNYGERVLLERFIAGRELAVSVVGTGLRPLPVVEIRTGGEVFGFESRPTVSPGAAEYLCPADLDEATLESALNVSREACAAIGIRDFARVDLILEDGKPFVLDLKTCPGLTETSLLPLAAAAEGLTFEDVVRLILDPALARQS